MLVWEGGGEDRLEEGAEAAVWSNSSALALDARRAVRCGARLVRLQWRRADAAGAAAWRDADLTSLHHHREVSNQHPYEKIGRNLSIWERETGKVRSRQQCGILVDFLALDGHATVVM